ncbi:MAG: hypothetical protein HYU98_07160, partial [Deltaproteobacteria bacterium]|nr:hypothetical protein [Deltaproteobacteria bacterium]
RLKFCLIVTLLFLSACSGCPSKEEEPVQVGSDTLTLKMTQQQKEEPSAQLPKIRVINIGPSKDDSKSSYDSDDEEGAADIPREVVVDDALTSRLKGKLKEAFAGRNTEPPEIDIFTGTMSLDAFAKHYEDKGYKIQRTSVPASQVIAPLLDEKPELSERINLGNYAGININQVIVEGANISAADKYIDPETYEIVYKTFVTVTKMR